MLHIQEIKLTQFKNYTAAVFEFPERIVAICGLNGVGKTNILDAVYYACFTRSYFSKTEAQNVTFGTDGFRIETLFKDGTEPQKLVAVYRGKKELSLNGIPYEKLADHIGKFPCVMVAPDDIELINGTADIRRKYLDILISQIDNQYLDYLIKYNKLLAQRNSLLKQLSEGQSSNYTLLDIFDNQLIEPSDYIFKSRQKTCEQLIPVAVEFYHGVCGGKEEVELLYSSKLLDSSLADLLKQSRQKDLALQRTSSGLHRDDLMLKINGTEFRTTASQGQKKSLLFALKLAEFELLKTAKGFTPVLLLDDVFEKLDEQRMDLLLDWVGNRNQGQVIITDTHCDRLEHSLSKMKTPFMIINLNEKNG